jgi:hypothetical protein
MTHWFDVLLGGCVALLGLIYKQMDRRVSTLEEYRLETTRVLAIVQEQSKENGRKLDYLIRRCDARREKLYGEPEG